MGGFNLCEQGLHLQPGNLERYTNSAYCHGCPYAQAGTCPFEHDYEALE